MNRKNEKIPKILEDYLTYLEALNYSPKTIKAYCLDLLCFFNFIKIYCNINIEVKDFNIFILLNINQKEILAFLVYLNQFKDNNPYTRQHKLTSIRMFYKWLIRGLPPDNNKINPTKYIENIEKVVRIPKVLNLEQSKKICNIFNKSNSRYALRNNTIISLLLNTGFRASELLSLNIKDINLKEKTIIITGKNKKERIIFINEKTKEKLLDYIIYRNKNEKIINFDDPLFINKNKKRLGIDGLEDICAKAYKLMGLEEYHYNVHTLRHTSAYILYNYVKSDILLLKEFLGHQSITSTEIYTYISNNRIKMAVDKNPLNIETEDEKIA